MQVPDKAERYIDQIFLRLDSSKRLVVFNMGASRPQKRWPAEHFAEATKKVVNAGFNVALVGGDNEQDQNAAAVVMGAIAESKLTCSVINLVGQTTLEQLSAVIKAGSVIVTADTGAMHIASALETPVVALFGSTKPGFTGPYGEGGKTVIHDLGLFCAPCVTHPTCNGRYDCMTGILPEHVLESILKLMDMSEEIVVCRTS
jgi:heptosyltransferase-1